MLLKPAATAFSTEETKKHQPKAGGKKVNNERERGFLVSITAKITEQACGHHCECECGSVVDHKQTYQLQFQGNLSIPVCIGKAKKHTSILCCGLGLAQKGG